MATLFVFQTQLLHMHSQCSIFITFPVMWVTRYNNSHIDGAAVAMSWAHSSPCQRHLQRTGHPRQGMAPSGTMRTKPWGLKEGAQQHLRPSCLSPASISCCWTSLAVLQPQMDQEIRCGLVPGRATSTLSHVRKPKLWSANLQQQEHKTQWQTLRP